MHNQKTVPLRVFHGLLRIDYPDSQDTPLPLLNLRLAKTGSRPFGGKKSQFEGQRIFEHRHTCDRGKCPLSSLSAATTTTSSGESAVETMCVGTMEAEYRVEKKLTGDSICDDDVVNGLDSLQSFSTVFLGSLDLSQVRKQ